MHENDLIEIYKAKSQIHNDDNEPNRYNVHVRNEMRKHTRRS